MQPNYGAFVGRGLIRTGDLQRMLVCAGVVASLAALPWAQSWAELRLVPSLTVSESVSDNVDQDPDGDEDAALITEVATGLSARWTTGRIQAFYTGSTRFRHQIGGDDEGFEVLPTLRGTGTAEISENLLFLDASAAVTQQLINTSRNDTSANRATTQSYRVSPYLVGHFGSFANGELRYTFDQIFVDEEDDRERTSIFRDDDDDLSDATTHTISARLTSGRDFSRLRWGTSGSASESFRVGASDVMRWNVGVNAEYAVLRSFSLLGGIGYEHFDDNDPENDIDGMTWDAGFRWRPGRRTDLTLTYGRSDGDERFEGQAEYRISPRSAIRASYTDRLTTGQERLSSGLGAIALDPLTGGLVDQTTGLPFDPRVRGASLVDQTERAQTFVLGMDLVRGRNTYQVAATVQFTEEENSDTVRDEEDSYGLDASWTRRLNPITSASLLGEYRRNTFEPEGRTDDEFSLGARVNYSLYSNVEAFAAYGFTAQASDDSSEEFTENVVTVGARIQF